MRKYIVLEKAVTMGSCDNLIRRIIIYETEKEGVYIFLSSSEDDIGCDADYWFEDVKSAEIYCKDYGIQQNDWIEAEDPLPNCQDDFIRPVRIKGRNIGNPQFGEYEILNDGVWVDFSID